MTHPPKSVARRLAATVLVCVAFCAMLVDVAHGQGGMVGAAPAASPYSSLPILSGGDSLSRDQRAGADDRRPRRVRRAAADVGGLSELPRRADQRFDDRANKCMHAVRRCRRVLPRPAAGWVPGVSRRARISGWASVSGRYVISATLRRWRSLSGPTHAHLAIGSLGLAGVAARADLPLVLGGSERAATRHPVNAYRGRPFVLGSDGWRADRFDPLRNHQWAATRGI